MLKTKIKAYSHDYSNKKARQRKTTIAELQKEVQKFEKKLAMINLSSEKAIRIIKYVNIKLDKVKFQLDEEMEYIARGALLRSKTKWFIEGEHSTKYFLTLEKATARNKNMQATRRHNGTLTKNAKEILDLQSEFYSKLYTSNSEIKFNEPIHGPSLSSAQQEQLDIDISVDEIGKAISEMPRNKSPGPDGLPVDFYKVFFVKIKHLLLEVFTHALKV